MTSVRESMEQAVLMSIGAAALTRERAEAAVDELVRKGQMGGDGSPAAGFVGRLEGGVQGVIRELGVVTRAELEDVQLRLMELEHRISLLERGPGTD